MRIVLLYPPPWKIASAPNSADAPSDGPPADHRPGDLDADFFQMPHGVLSLAAQAIRAGHQVKVLNLSAFPWPQVQNIIEHLDADLFGISCFTANRRGTACAAKAIRDAHPATHIVVGGPHASALAKETLEHWPAVDTVVVGEGEESFLELIACLKSNRPPRGIAGTVYRDGPDVQAAPPRPRIADLDALASPHDYFDTHLFMTSRGCPGRCTFCAKHVVWGNIYRTHSTDYVLDSLENALDRLPLKMIMIKDDTFTADRKRALRVCEGIRDRRLNFIWSCDTRADALDEGLLRAMRIAGCQRLSIGVESGSPTVLQAINKRVTPETILRSTRLAKSVGMQVRYFMMLGNRAETVETFRESLAFVRSAQPHQALFACLSVYPGTDDFAVLEKHKVLTRDVYFNETFLELKMPFDASEQDTSVISDWFEQNRGLRDIYRDSPDELRAVLERVGEVPSAHLDLGAAYFRADQLDNAEAHVQKALDLGYPLPGLAHSYLACICGRRGRCDSMLAHVEQSRQDPQHYVVQHNLRAVHAWVEHGGTKQGKPPSLIARHDFELLQPTRQPNLPGPVPTDVCVWND